MQEPIDSSGELMKDRRYGTGLREPMKHEHEWQQGEFRKDKDFCQNPVCNAIRNAEIEPSFGSADYWKTECIKERERRGDIWKVVGRLDAVSKGFGTAGMDSPEETAGIIKGWLEAALNETEGSDDN